MDEPNGKRTKRGATSELNHDNWDQVFVVSRHTSVVKLGE